MLTVKEMMALSDAGRAAFTASLHCQSAAEFLCAMGQPGDEPGGTYHTFAVQSAANAEILCDRLSILMSMLLAAALSNATAADHEAATKAADALKRACAEYGIGSAKEVDNG